MVSLMDVGEARETVPIRNKDVEVTGITAKGLLVLLSRFPEVRKMVASRGQDVSAEDLMTLAPEAIACVIASGCGSPGDKKMEAVAAGLNAGEQLDLLGSILRLTFPQGVLPFVEKLTSMVGMGSLGADGTGWAPGMKSQEELNNSSHTAIQAN